MADTVRASGPICVLDEFSMHCFAFLCPTNAFYHRHGECAPDNKSRRGFYDLASSPLCGRREGAMDTRLCRSAANSTREFLLMLLLRSVIVLASVYSLVGKEVESIQQ